MAEPVPGGSQSSQELNVNNSDVEVRRIIRRVAKNMNAEISGVPKNIFELDKSQIAFLWTGLHPKVIKEMENGELSIAIGEVDRSTIYDKLVDFYLKSKIMPTSFQLFLALEDCMPKYMDLDQFQKLLVKQGFMWKHILGSSFVVIEKPQVTFDRYFYLSNIIRHRTEEKHIYYIDENAFNSQGNYFSVKQSKMAEVFDLHRIIYAVSKSGVNFLSSIESFTADAVLKWVRDKLLLSLNGPSVIVMNNSKHLCEEIVSLPNVESCRSEMLAWLDYFDIPYDEDMTKPLLYDLIVTYTDITQRKYRIDELLKTNGHTVLRVPNCIKKLTPATHVFDIIKINLPTILSNSAHQTHTPSDIIKIIDGIIATINEDIAANLSELISYEENAILEKDKLVDDCMDSLQDKMLTERNETFQFDTDLPSCSDSESD